MTAIPGMIKDTIMNQHIFRRHILVYWWAGYSVSEISRKLNIDDAIIHETLIAQNKELAVYFKEAN